MASQFAVLPCLRTPDVLVSGSPSFPALLPGIVHARLRRVPWLLWLHDILPDAATSTGLVRDGLVLNASRWLERVAYGAATQIVVPSPPFVDNLLAKGVPSGKIRLIRYPATRVPRSPVSGAERSPTPRLLTMGNIGCSQGLGPLVRAFEEDASSGCEHVKFVLIGEGVAADEVRAHIRTDRVEMPGLVDDDRLERELQRATLALVSQQYVGGEFNIPSKMMNFMAYGLPILASVDPRGEVARIIEQSNGGWVVDSRQPESFPRVVADLLARPEELAHRGRAAERYARENFSREAFGAQFDEALRAAARTPAV